MEPKKIRGVSIPRHDTAINWSKAINFTPKRGELIVFDADTEGTVYDITTVSINGVTYPVEPSTKIRFKFGDGVSNVNALPFVSNDSIDGAAIYVSETDSTSIVMNDESNIAGSFGFNVSEGRSEVVGNKEYGYYKIDMSLTTEADLEKAKEDFETAVAASDAEIEANEKLTPEQKAAAKLESRRISLHLFKTEDDSKRFDTAEIYIDSFTKAKGYWEIKTKGFVYYPDSTENPYVFDSGSYIRIIGFPKIGTVNVDGYSFAAGINNKALGNGSFSIGRNNISNGAYSATFGRDNTVAYNGTAFGRYNTVDGQIGTVFGQHNEITGHDSLAAGLFNLVEGAESSALGIKNIATGEAQTVVGKANEKDDSAYFIVGNGKTDRTEGTPIERSNAFVVKKDGSAKVQGDLIVKGRNILETQSISEIVSELPTVGEVNKIYIADKNEYVYVSKPDSKKSEVWSGKLAEGFSKGSGTEADPYIIETAEELATAINGKAIITSITPVIDLFTKRNDSNYSIDYLADYGVLPAGQYTVTFTGTSGTLTLSQGYETGSGDVYHLTASNPNKTITIRRSNNTGNIGLGDSLQIYSTSSNISESDFTVQYNGSTNIESTTTNMIGDNCYFKLNNNIYLNDVSKVDWYKDTSNKPWFTGAAQEYYVKDINGNDTEETTTFLGHIDGNGYTVNGIWYANDSTINNSHLSSLIPTAKSGTTIKNLGICKSHIVSFRDESVPEDVRGQTAGFVANTVTGSKPSITFENCYIDENTYLYGGNDAGCAAGFLGYAKTNSGNPNVLKNCYSLVPFSHYKGQSSKCNGLIGEVWNTYFTIENCYSIYKPFEGSGSTLPQGTFNNVYSITGANSASMAKYTKLTESELKKVNLGEAFGLTDTYPKLINFGYWEQISSVDPDSKPPHIWDGSIATEFAGGDGTEATPYIIETPEQFALMVENFGDGHYYKIVNDLYFNDVNLDKTEWTNTEWYCIPTAPSSNSYKYTNRKNTEGTFNGTIEGNGHSIYGLYHTNTSHDTTALIPTMGTGSIQNLAIKNSSLTANDNVGGFVGRTARDAYPNGSIDIINCYVGSDVELSGKNPSSAAGGIVGYAAALTTNRIVNCYCLSTLITGGQPIKISGLIGQCYSTPYILSNCYSIISPINTNNEGPRRSTLVSQMGFESVYKNIYSASTRAYKANESVNGAYVFTKRTIDNMKGLDVLNNTSKMSGLVGEYVITSTYPTLKPFVSETEAIASDAYVKAFSGDTGDLSNYQEKFAEVTKNGELTTGIQFTTDISEALTNTARVELQSGGIELSAYGSISLDTHNGPISINSNQDVVLNSSYGNIDVSNKRIKNVATPTDDTDASNKKYVDDTIAYAMNETQADYVVEQGASGIWTYRKWASGKAECWGRKHITTSMSQVTNNTFYYLNTSFPETDYPFVFTAAPSELVTYHAPSSHMGWVYSQWENTNSHSGQYCAMRWNSVTSEADVYLDYYVVGMWK